MKVWGYARCSTNDELQDIQRQTRELKAAGAQVVHCEYEHGDAEHKAELEKLFDAMEPGDTLIVTEVSRLSRSTKQLCGVIDRVQQNCWKLVILNSITIDCSQGDMDSMSKAFLQMAGVFSELELAMTRERVKSGLANARAKGKQLGRRRTTYDDIPENVIRHYPQYKNKMLNTTEYARVCGLSRTTIYKYINIMESRAQV